MDPHSAIVPENSGRSSALGYYPEVTNPSLRKDRLIVLENHLLTIPDIGALVKAASSEAGYLNGLLRNLPDLKREA